MPRLQEKKESGKLSAQPGTPNPAPSGLTRSPLEWLLVKIAIIALAAAFVYAPAFHGDWLWDDDQEIWQNTVLEHDHGLREIWNVSIIGRVSKTAIEKWFMGKEPDPLLFKPGDYRPTDYFPLKASVQWILYQFWGVNKTAWHVTNVVLHIIGSLLVWRLLARFNLRAAWWGGLLFAIHPINVESVAWVSELKNTLSLPFMVLSMTAFIDFERNGKLEPYLWSIVAFLAGILSKTSVVMMPVVILLYLWWNERGTVPPALEKPANVWSRLVQWWKTERLLSWRAVRLSAPFFAISLILGIITIGFQHANAIAAEKILVGDMVSRTATAGLAILFYFSKCVLPIGLNVIYPRWDVDPPHLWQFLPWPILVVAFLWLWTYRKSWGRHVLLCLGFFLINLIPVLGFVVMSYMRITWVADHFLYIPVIGIVGLFTAAGSMVYDKVRENLRPILISTASALAAVVLLMSHGYANIFVDEDALWTYTLKRNPNAWQAHNRLGAKQFSRGEVESALYHFQSSSRLRPDLGETHNNLGAALMQLGRKEEAIVAFEKALKATPNILATQANLANAYAQAGRWEDSAKLFQDLVSEKKKPGNPVFHGNLGAVLLQLNRKEEAIYHLRRAYEINPNLQGLKESLKRAGAPVETRSLTQPMSFKLGE